MSDVLLTLTDADLWVLAAALRSGRLAPPFTAVGLGQFCSGAAARPLATRMQELAEEGLKGEYLALLAETVIRSRSLRPQEGGLVDLVWTGPEGPGAATRDTGVVVRELFSGATESVLIAGYAVHQGRDVFQSLAQRMAERPEVRVRMFLDVQRHSTDTSLDAELLARFAHRFRTQEWPGERLPELFYDPRSLSRDAAKRSSLHAKCVVIDRRVAFVSSANFTEAAQVRNIEVGVLVSAARFAADLSQHFEGLAEKGVLRSIPLGC
jgi:phosphatidylserine/phosphatidylglycerophosphate/cardiolipin synthase-like enzyme